MIEIKNVKKDYPIGDNVVKALKGININFRDNEFVSILGPSGCGKTTLLNIVGGLDKYTDGDIVIDGVSTKSYKDRDWDNYRNHYIGFVFQSYNLISHLSILENVELALSIAGLNKKEKREKATLALQRVGLEDQLKKKPNQLSGGQMQRVAIARAIVNNPKIILADEPTGALDSGTSIQIMDILKEISKTCLVVMVTHNGELAEKYSDRIINILDGELTHDSNPYEKDLNINEEEKPVNENMANGKNKKKKQKHSAMSLFTAFFLSFKNLISKKMKTLLVSFAGSIGIIGIALVLSVSNGLNGYISSMQSDTLSGYPVTIGTAAVDFGSIQNNLGGSSEESTIDKNTHVGLYNLSELLQRFGTFNYLNDEFINYVNSYYAQDKLKPIENQELIDVCYSYNSNLQILTEVGNMGVFRLDSKQQISIMSSTVKSGVFYQGLKNKDYILENYDVLGGKNAHFPQNKNEVALVISSGNSIAVETLNTYGISVDKNLKEYEFSQLLGKEYKVMPNDMYYQKDKNYLPLALNDFGSLNFVASPIDMQNYYDSIDDENILKISCVLRAKEESVGEVLSEGIMYTAELTDYLRAEAKNSEIYNATLSLGLTDNLYVPYNLNVSELNSIGGNAEYFKYNTLQEMIDKVNAEPFNLNLTIENARELALQMIGASDIPNSISIYTNSFESKQNVINYISDWNNETHTANNKITYSDATEFLTNTLGTLIDIISYVLIAFAGISLVVSSIMIGIITYTSVIERTKEIGVLRSIGARKKDITRVFNSETFIIGFVSGTIGVLISFMLTFPISSLIKSVAGGAITSSMAILTLQNAITLISISTILTLISGLIPARFASKKDPVKALRTE